MCDAIKEKTGVDLYQIDTLEGAQEVAAKFNVEVEPIVFVSVLENVNDFCVTFENGANIQLNSILNKHASVIKHITKESLIEDVI